MARIYTRTGDDGMTGLIGGKRVPKDSAYTEACGTLDELNALIGIARALRLPEDVDRTLMAVQDDLFTLGAELATPKDMVSKTQKLTESSVQRLENEIDSLEGSLEPLRKFILPGGSVPGAYLHLARAVARRAERHCVTFSRIEPVNPNILRYLNRLSDLCFVMARYVNRMNSMPEHHPHFGKP